MRTSLAYSLPTALALVLVTAVSAALAGQSSRVAFRTFTVQGHYLQGPIQGPWEWSEGVSVEGSGLTMTSDRLKVWPTADGRDFERVEATGSIVIKGLYVAADKTEWRILGKAASATYEAKAAQGVLRGSVSFEATNLATSAVLSVKADKLSYDFKQRRFRFERIDRPVRLEWQEPLPEAPPEGGSADQPESEPETD
jgi:lipopolysaccharide export system protein LptA